MKEEEQGKETGQPEAYKQTVIKETHEIGKLLEAPISPHHSIS
jgi:hypothetical protein